MRVACFVSFVNLGICVFQIEWLWCISDFVNVVVCEFRELYRVRISDFAKFMNFRFSEFCFRQFGIPACSEFEFVYALAV